MSGMTLCLFASTPDIAPLGFIVKVLTGPFDTIAQTAIAWGYDGIEFMPDPEHVPDPMKCERALKSAGAQMPVVNSGRIFAQGLALLHQEATIRQRAMTGFKAMLDFGGYFRSKVHLGIARGSGIPGASRAEMDGMAEDIFRELTDHAEQTGATIVLEPAESNLTSYINTMADVMAWVDRIASPAFRPMLDTHQLYGAEASVESGIRAARGMAQHIHLYDPSRWPPGVRTGTETLDWLHIAHVLREEGFSGSGSVVLIDQGDPESSARASAAYLRRLFREPRQE